MLKLKEIIPYFSEYLFENIDKNLTISSIEIDSRNIISGSVFIALKGENTNGHNYLSKAIDDGAILCAVENDYNNINNYPIVKCDNVELFLRKLANIIRKNSKAKIIAITGTNGKTSTKDLLLNLLKTKFKTIGTEGNYNNILGVPLTLGKIKKDTEIVVVEMGINHFSELTELAIIAEPDYGIITNIGNGHLEAFVDKKGVLKAKLELFNYINDKKGVFFLNNSDEFLEDFFKNYKTTKAKIIDYNKTIKATINSEGKSVVSMNNKQFLLNSYGIYNSYNAQAAIAIAKFFGINNSDIEKVLQESTLSAKRGEEITVNNSTIIIDCYNANPSSVNAALSSLHQRSYNKLLLVLGDMLELGKNTEKAHHDLAIEIKKLRNVDVLLFGENMLECYNSLKHEKNIETTHFYKYEQLLERFNQDKDNYDLILLKGSRLMKLERLVEKLK